MQFFLKFSLIFLVLVGASLVLGLFMGPPPSADILGSALVSHPGPGEAGFRQSLFFTVFGLAVGVGSVLSLFLWELDKKHRTARATAEVTEVGEMSVYSEGEHLDAIVVTCRHQVGDTWHSGSFRAGLSTNIGFIAKWEKARFAPGSEVAIVYDPDHPGDVAIPTRLMSFTSLLMLGLTGVGLWLFFLLGSTFRFYSL